MSGPRAERRLAAILAAGVAGYSRLTGISFSSALALDPQSVEEQHRLGAVLADRLFAMFMIAFPLFVSASP
jgi:hypothetical protein